MTSWRCGCGVAIALLGACKRAAPSEPAANASGASPGSSTSDATAGDATTPPAARPPCLRPVADSSRRAPTRLGADARALYLCAGSAEPDDAKPQCFAVDRATGTYATWTPPPAAPAAPLARVTATDDGVTVCDPAATCTTIRPARGELSSPVTNAAGTYVAFTVHVEGKQTAIDVYDVATRKRTAHLALTAAETGCGAAELLDDVVLVVDDNCGGPDGRGTLYTAKGKRLATLDDAADNAYDPQPVHLEATRWAIGLPMSGVVAIVDVSTGKQLAQVALDKLDGTAKELGPPTLALARGDPGKLLVATGAASIGVLDVASGALELAWTATACPEAP